MAKGGKGGGGNTGGAISGNKRDNLLTGTAADDVILGKDGNDTLEGLGGNDSLDGGNGDDLLIGGLGDDTIEGGSGTDMVVLTGTRGDYTVTQIDATTVEITGPDGTDTITSVESFQFADITQSFAEVVVPWQPDLAANAITVDATSVLEGDALTIDWSVSSSGLADADTAYTNVVLATAPDMAAVVEGSALLSTGTLDTGTSASFSTAFDTTGLAPGTYYLAAIADSTNLLAESDETNNVTDWVAVTIEPQVVDYSMDSVAVLPSSDLDLGYADGMSGARIDVELSFSSRSNTGPTSFTVVTYLSTDTVLSQDDFDIGYGQYSLGYGDSLTTGFSFDTGEYFPGGDYYVISVIYQDVYSEPWDDESDNIIVSDGPISLVGGWTYGTNGDDVFTGTPYQEFFEGYEGDDTLLSAGTDDVFLGGDGVDTVDYSGLSEGVIIYDESWSQPDTLRVEPFMYDTYTEPGFLVGVERIIGTDYDDQLYIAEASANDLSTGLGNDTVLGSYGDDVIDTGAGDDLIGGIFGNDVITTGEGFDMIFVDRNPDGFGGFSGHGHDVVTDFDPLTDLLLVEYSASEGSYDPFADLTQTAEGARLDMADDSSILLLGVDMSDLNTMNLGAVEEGPALVWY